MYRQNISTFSIFIEGILEDNNQFLENLAVNFKDFSLKINKLLHTSFRASRSNGAYLFQNLVIQLHIDLKEETLFVSNEN